jgi:hypothetical protein
MYPLRIFHGSLRIQCDLKERGLWYELVFLAKICQVAEIFPANDVVDHEHVEKLISANESTPYPYSYLAEFFGVDLAWLEYALNKLKDQRRIREDERGIWIINWEKYQPEYDRQRIYRDKEKVDQKVDHPKRVTNMPDCLKCKVPDYMTRIKDKDDTKLKCEKCGTVYTIGARGKIKEEHEQS